MKNDQNDEMDEKWVEALDRLRTPFDASSALAAKAAVMARIDAEVPLARLVQISSMWTGMRAAAAIALLVALPFIVYFVGLQSLTNRGAVELTAVLPDGSAMVLSPGTTIRYQRLFWKAARRVTLQGEVFFEVVPGSKFVVSGTQGRVEVTGTSFSVWSGSEIWLVHCLTGSVVNYSCAGETPVRAGELCSCNSSDMLLELQTYSSDKPLLPQVSEVLHFDGAPLSLVCAELSKVYSARVESKLDPALRYTGALNTRSREETFQVLCKTFGAVAEEHANGVAIKINE